MLGTTLLMRAMRGMFTVNLVRILLSDKQNSRKAIKKPLTDRAMKGILSKLNNFTDDDLEKIEILENSIVNCWQGIFPLKEKTPIAVGGQIKNNKFNNSICSSSKNYTRGVEML